MSETEASLDKNYVGYAVHVVDEKRRLQIPARWRPTDSKVEMTLMIWKGHKEGVCLRVYPPKEMQAIREKLETMSTEDKGRKKKSLAWVVGKNSESVTVDKTGRMCLPERMAKAAGISKQAAFVGLVNTFEIWDPELQAPQDEKYTEVVEEEELYDVLA